MLEEIETNNPFDFVDEELFGDPEEISYPVTYFNPDFETFNNITNEKIYKDFDEFEEYFEFGELV